MDGKFNPKIQNKFWQKFKDWCHQAIVQGYYKLLSKQFDYCQREEEDISAALCLEMEELPLIKSKQISIVPEFRLYGEKVRTGIQKAKEAEIIDFQFAVWKPKTQKKYFGEAKNISHKTWNKEGGGRVDASHYRGRYIDTGIEKIVSGEYSVVESFLIGYVVNGTSEDNINALNSLINKRNLTPRIGIIEKDSPISGHEQCYTSVNQRESSSLVLRHIFLEFDKE